MWPTLPRPHATCRDIALTRQKAAFTFVCFWHEAFCGGRSSYAETCIARNGHLLASKVLSVSRVVAAISAARVGSLFLASHVAMLCNHTSYIMPAYLQLSFARARHTAHVARVQSTRCGEGHPMTCTSLYFMDFFILAYTIRIKVTVVYKLPGQADATNQPRGKTSHSAFNP